MKQSFAETKRTSAGIMTPAESSTTSSGTGSLSGIPSALPSRTTAAVTLSIAWSLSAASPSLQPSPSRQELRNLEIANPSPLAQPASVNRNQTIRTAGDVGVFCARHFLATLVTVSALGVLWTVTYFALLIWAAVSGAGLGSPASYPLGLLVALAGGTAVALALFLPATALAEWIAKRRGLPILAQIPISIAILAALCLVIIGTAVAAGMQATFRGVAAGFALLFLAHLPPLGLYWWVAQSGPLLVSFYKQLRKPAAKN